MPYQLRGTLRDLPTSQMLHLIDLAQKTGTYRLYGSVPTGYKDEVPTRGNGRSSVYTVPLGTERVRISFLQGKLIHATTTGPESHLASVLYKAGKLNLQKYLVFRESATHHGDKALALSLINANYVTQGDVIQSLRQHMLGILFDVLTWNQELFTFEEGELLSSDWITVSIDLENIVLESSRRVHELRDLLQAVPSLDLVLKFADRPVSTINKIVLKVDDWHVLSLVNSHNSIAWIANECHMTDTEIRRIVARFLRAGLVEPVEKPKPKSLTLPNARPLMLWPARVKRLQLHG